MVKESEDNEEISEDKSVFNSALAQLERINNILNFILSKFFLKDFGGWNDGLNCLSREISYSFKEEEVEDDLNYETLINPLVAEWKGNTYFDEKKQEYLINSDADEEYFETHSKLYSLLIEYEKFLKGCYDKRKMLGAKADSPEFALES